MFRRSFIVLCGMIVLGIGSFASRSFIDDIGSISDAIVDALGTIAWAGTLAAIISIIINFFSSKNLSNNRRFWYVLFISLLISWSIEFLQRTNFLISYQQNIFIHLIFGSAFSWLDFPFYAAGVLFSSFYIFLIKK